MTIQVSKQMPAEGQFGAVWVNADGDTMTCSLKWVDGHLYRVVGFGMAAEWGRVPDCDIAAFAMLAEFIRIKKDD